MRLLEIKKSTNPKKKWMAVFCKCEGSTKCDPKDRKTVHFGAAGYTDYTLPPHDKEKRRLYRIRHGKEKDQAPDTPGALSYHILWGESTSMNENLKSFRKKLSC
jgi:hypothetical protein